MMTPVCYNTFTLQVPSASGSGTRHCPLTTHMATFLTPTPEAGWFLGGTMEGNNGSKGLLLSLVKGK